MSSTIFILAINAGVALVIAGAFAALAFHDRAFASARWIAIAYLLGALYYGGEFLISLAPDSRLLAVAGYSLFLAALAAYAMGIARRYSADPPWRLLGALLLLSLALNIYTQSLPRELILRNVLWQLPYAALQAVPLVIILQTGKLRGIDKCLSAALALSMVHFLLKPMIAAETGGPGATAAAYLDTVYALFSQSAGTILTVLVALMTVGVYVSSMLSDANRRSETDTLSGLLNRRGFLEKAGELFAAASGPTALVLADIDNFKSVNDTFGHAAGDRVIEAFSDVLAQATDDGHVLGRIGGEEFAILLAGTEVATARLIAEGIRVALSEAEVAGLPETYRVTASFGVAQWREGVSYDELFRQADAALYQAKNAGRNCVRVAPPVLRIDDGRNDPPRRAYRNRG